MLVLCVSFCVKCVCLFVCLFVCLCTGHFLVVPLTWPHQLCLHHFFFQHSRQNLLNCYDYVFSLSHTCVFLKSTIEVIFAINVGNRLLLPFLIHKSMFMLYAIASSKYVYGYCLSIWYVKVRAEASFIEYGFTQKSH